MTRAVFAKARPAGTPQRSKTYLDDLDERITTTLLALQANWPKGAEDEDSDEDSSQDVDMEEKKKEKKAVKQEVGCPHSQKKMRFAGPRLAHLAKC